MSETQKNNNTFASWSLLHKPKDLPYVCMCHASLCKCACVCGCIGCAKQRWRCLQWQMVSPQLGSSETIKRAISGFLTGLHERATVNSERSDVARSDLSDLAHPLRLTNRNTKKQQYTVKYQYLPWFILLCTKCLIKSRAEQETETRSTFQMLQRIT